MFGTLPMPSIAEEIKQNLLKISSQTDTCQVPINNVKKYTLL
jgi:hypothetical protein